MARRYSSFTISKEWGKFIPFLLIPFCAVPNVLLNSLQFQDLARIYFGLTGFVLVITLRRKSWRMVRPVVLLAIVLLAFNSLANIWSACKFGFINITSSPKLMLMMFIGIVLPLCGIKHLVENTNQYILHRLYMIPIIIVLVISALQILALFNIDFILVSYYKTTLFKYVEGVWVGVPRTVSNVEDQFRILGTFHEPSVLATFMLLYAFPFLLSRTINDLPIFGKYIDHIVIVLSLVVLIFSFSTTSYILLTIDSIVATFLFWRRTNGFKRIFVIAIILMLLCCIISVIYNEYLLVVMRAFDSESSQSSATRLGSIQGAANMFFNNLLYFIDD